MALGVISQALRNIVQQPATAQPAQGSAEYIDGRAVICYQSLFDDFDVVITGSNDAAGFPASNINNGLTYTYWTPASGGTNYINFSAVGGKRCGYLGIAGHSLFSNAASIDFQWSDDGVTGWTSLLGGGYAPGTDSPFCLLFTEVQKLFFRLVINSPSDKTPRIAVAMAGPQFSLQRGIYVGHRPAPFNRDIKYKTNESETGQFLGRSVLRRANVTQFELSRITPAWFRSSFWAFQQAAEQNPFFFLWDIKRVQYKSEVIFGYLVGSPQPMNSHQTFMTVAMDMRGLA